MESNSLAHILQNPSTIHKSNPVKFHVPGFEDSHTDYFWNTLYVKKTWLSSNRPSSL